MIFYKPLSLLILAFTVFILNLTHASDQQDVKIDVLQPAEDCARRARNGDTLLVHYSGRLSSDGSEFDSSYKRDQPFSVKLGAGRVIKGWENGLQGICKGEVRMLTIPPELGYGDRGFPPVIPGGAELKFKVELVDFGGAKEEL